MWGLSGPASTRSCSQHLTVGRRLLSIMSFTDLASIFTDLALPRNQLPNTGSICEPNYTFHWHGNNTVDHRKHGLGYAVSNRLLLALKIPVATSEHLLSPSLSSKGFINIISAHAPTPSVTAADKDQFYDTRHDTLTHIPNGKKVFHLGDFNAHVSAKKRSMATLHRSSQCWKDEWDWWVIAGIMYTKWTLHHKHFF